MRGPDAYPELILAAAQEEIQALAHERARERARRGARRRWWGRVPSLRRRRG